MEESKIPIGYYPLNIPSTFESEPYQQNGVYTGIITLLWLNDKNDLEAKAKAINDYLNGMFDSATVNLIEVHPTWMKIRYQRPYEKASKFQKVMVTAVERIKERLTQIFGEFTWSSYSFDINQEVKTMNYPEMNMGYKMADPDIKSNHAHYLDGF